MEHLGPTAARADEGEGALRVGVATNGVQKIAPLPEGLTPRLRASSSTKQLDVAVRHPCKTLKVMRREILNRCAGWDRLSSVAGNAWTNLEKALFEGGNDLLNRRRPTCNDPIVEEEAVVVELTWEARFRDPSSLGDAEWIANAKRDWAEWVALLHTSLTADQ